jgi:hypothetical protein
MVSLCLYGIEDRIAARETRHAKHAASVASAVAIRRVS